MRKISVGAVVATLVVAVPSAAPAATITNWNLGNVNVVPDAPGSSTGASVVYDRDVTGGTGGATTNGKVLWATTPSPGLSVLNDDPSLNPNISVPDCIVAVNSACEAPFQSDKRVKIAATSTGPIDLVFDTTPDGENNSYQVFSRIINLTPSNIGSMSIELGYGIGSSFVQSGLGDGLSFDLSAQLGPNNEPAYTQFPFGLFGDASTNPNQTLDGFFDGTNRAGFGLTTTADLISTTGLTSNYASLFGPGMMNDASLPTGYFWDNDGDPTTDPLLMAWFDGTNWVQRRAIDPNDPTAAIPITPTVVSEAYLSGLGFTSAPIEDLRNLNLNFNILTASSFAGSQFTLRINTTPVPEPASWAMMIAGFGLIGAAMRRKRQSVAYA